MSRRARTAGAAAAPEPPLGCATLLNAVIPAQAGYCGKRFVFEKAKELGIRSVVLEGADSWARGLEEDGIIERFVPIDMG